jgi:hypothetical protein
LFEFTRRWHSNSAIAPNVFTGRDSRRDSYGFILLYLAKGKTREE